MGVVLGLIGSARVWGNSEVLAREALLGASEEGAQVRLLRLTELQIRPCTGCMRCAIRRKPCPLEDDMEFLISQVRAADGLIVVAPTYFLGPPGTLKLALDRLLMLTPYWLGETNEKKPGAAIAVSGLRDWRGVTMPFLNGFLLAFGFRPLGNLFCHAPGPGEVLLDEEAMAKAHELGRRVARGEAETMPSPSNVCPVCGSDFFTLEGERAICPICGMEAECRMVRGSIRLAFATPSSAHRWSKEGLREHVEGWIVPSGARFMERRHAIKALRQRYGEMGDIWVRR